jgi:type I restriction enzyme, S subunit
MSIPKGWKISSIGEITSKIHQGINIAAEKAEYSDFGIPILRAKDMTSGVLNFEGTRFLSQENYASYRNKYQPLPGQILFSNRGTIGKPYLVNQINKFLVEWNILIIEPLSSSSSSFICLSLEYLDDKKYFESLSTGNATKFINLSTISKIPILLPPIREQCKIAEILGVWDELIDLLEKLITAKRKLKYGITEQLLTGKKRFKEFDGIKCKGVKIKNLLRESRLRGSNGLAAKKITVKLYCKGVFAKDEKRLGSENTNYFTRKSGQFIYSKLDFLNGAFGIIPDELDGYESTLDLPCFDFNDNANPKFIFYFVGRESFYSRFKNQAIGGRKARRVSPDEFLGTEIQLPSLQEQEKVAAVLSAADTEISTLEKQLAAYKQQKRGLMQQLLTGRTRILGLEDGQD